MDMESSHAFTALQFQKYFTNSIAPSYADCVNHIITESNRSLSLAAGIKDDSLIHDIKNRVLLNKDIKGNENSFNLKNNVNSHLILQGISHGFTNKNTILNEQLNIPQIKHNVELTPHNLQNNKPDQVLKPHKCHCGKSFKRPDHLRVHQTTHSDLRPYNCEQCGKNFGRLEHLKTHAITHSGIKPFKCKDCGKEFGRIDNLQRHQIIHSEERPHTCGQCTKSFKRIEHLKKHLLTHSVLNTNRSEEGLYNCVVSISPDIQIEVGDEDQVKKFNAEIFTNLTPPSLHWGPPEHLKHESKYNIENFLSNSDKSSTYSKDNINEVSEIVKTEERILFNGNFHNPELITLQNHYKSVNDAHVQVKVENTSEDTLSNNSNFVMKKGYENISDIGRYNQDCDVINLENAYRIGNENKTSADSDVNVHKDVPDMSLIEPFLNNAYIKEEIKLDEISDGVELHRQLEIYKNSIIGENINNVSQIFEPVSGPSESRPFSCEKCGKTYIRLEHLKRHEMTHLNIRPHRCEECGRCFGRVEHLKNHMVTHTGIKAYKCDECGRCFGRLENLKRHESIHSDSTPYGCEQCGKSFSRMEHLKYHLRNHSGIRPFKCQECGKTFTRKEHWKTHVFTHTGIKPFKCDMCGKCFGRNEHLKRHLLTHSSSNTVFAQITDVVKVEAPA